MKKIIIMLCCVLLALGGLSANNKTVVNVNIDEDDVSSFFSKLKDIDFSEFEDFIKSKELDKKIKIFISELGLDDIETINLSFDNLKMAFADTKGHKGWPMGQHDSSNIREETRRFDFSKGLSRLESLTDAQKKKIENLETTHQKALIDKRASLEKLNIDREIAIRDGKTADEKKIVNDIAKIKADIEIMNIELRVNIKKELTQEQRDSLNKRPRGKKAQY
jgi:Spy/CpxP family protein refolding chaperone